jgi:mannose-6-phosphate isomerase-like protein (cupin superfamily)
MNNPEGIIPKAWGRELILFSNDAYCLKKMVFDKAGNRFSLHFHVKKHESWVVAKGSFRVTWIDTKTADGFTRDLGVGAKWVNPQYLPHMLTALEDDSVMLEVSTADDPEDNYRIAKGQSQGQ